MYCAAPSISDWDGNFNGSSGGWIGGGGVREEDRLMTEPVCSPGSVRGKREREQAQGLSESWFNNSPWFTTPISSLLGPLIILVLILSFGPYILNCLVAFVKEHIGTVQLMTLKQRYKELDTEDQEYELSEYQQ